MQTLDPSRIESQKSETPSGILEVAIVRLLIDVGFQHKRIAALFDCNQGRIAEIATGARGPGISYHFRPLKGPWSTKGDEHE